MRRRHRRLVLGKTKEYNLAGPPVKRVLGSFLRFLHCSGLMPRVPLLADLPMPYLGSCPSLPTDVLTLFSSHRDSSPLAFVRGSSRVLRYIIFTYITREQANPRHSSRCSYLRVAVLFLARSPPGGRQPVDRLSAVDQSADPGSDSLRNPNTRITPFFILRAIVVRLSRGGLTQDSRVGVLSEGLSGQPDRAQVAPV